jgi:predicted lipid-binding transport protein (Tim44 family)
MSTRPVTRFIAAAMIAVAGVAMLAASFDADARRMGGGSSFGRQSTNVMHSRPATATPSMPAAAPRAVPPVAAPAAGAAAGAAAATGARSGASRWLGPIAGIAAGLGIGALLSHMGLSGAFGQFLSSALLIALVIFAVMFVVRRLRGVGPRPAAQAAFGQGGSGGGNAPPQPIWRESLNAGAQVAPVATVASLAAPVPAVGTDESAWFVPGDFDTPRFLAQAKQQFIAIQALWDSGQTDRLREFLTDDLIAELKPQLVERGESRNTTEVVLLNAELLGVESVSGGNLASVRFSGMLREAAGAEAFRFEEVWNLFKPEQGGWMLAGIQQIPVEYAS